MQAESPVQLISAPESGSTPSSQKNRKQRTDIGKTREKKADRTGRAADPVDALAATAANLALAPRSIEALELDIESQEQKLLSMKIKLQQLMASSRAAPPAHSEKGDFKCFGCIIFLPNPSMAVERTWIDSQSLQVPHIMLVVDYCSGSLKNAGGWSRPGESEVECMNREFFEETGYKHPVCRFRLEDLRNKVPGSYHGRPIHTCTFVKYATLYDLHELRMTPCVIPCLGETAAVAFLPLAPSADSIKNSNQHTFPRTCLRTMARDDEAVGLRLKIVNMLRDFPEFDSLYDTHKAAAVPSDAPSYARHFLTWMSLDMSTKCNPNSEANIKREAWFYRRLLFEDAKTKSVWGCEYFLPPTLPSSDLQVGPSSIFSHGVARSELENANGDSAATECSRVNSGDTRSRIGDGGRLYVSNINFVTSKETSTLTVAVFASRLIQIT
jgi:8-oxo-dGTP pyrophosphatase MutT (NUDIX family)